VNNFHFIFGGVSHNERVLSPENLMRNVVLKLLSPGWPFLNNAQTAGR
jgi:hypothetical protein